MNFNDIDLDEQNRLLNVAKSAEEEFSSDQDKEKLIKVYESVFCRKQPLRSNSRARKLALLYIESDRKKDALKFLDSCVRHQLMPLESIRTIQADLYKKEGQYYHAIEFYLVASLAEEHGAFFHDYDRIAKKIKPCIKMVKWGDQEVGYLVYLIRNHIENNNFSEVDLVDSYRCFLKEKGIEY